MSDWKFCCELKESITLPPEYTFPQAFNYLNPKTNSFYILDSPAGDYIQCAGDPQRCTVEVRYYDETTKKHHRHFTLGASPVTEKISEIPMPGRNVKVRASEVLDRWQAIQLFECFFKAVPFPEWIYPRQIFL